MGAHRNLLGYSIGESNNIFRSLPAVISGQYGPLDRIDLKIQVALFTPVAPAVHV